MRKLKRVVELYIGEGSDNGTWRTDYVEIDRDAPESQIERLALAQGEIDFGQSEGYMFSGIYCIPSLEDSDEIMEYVVLAVEEGEEFQEFVYATGLPVPAHTDIGVELVNEEGEDEVVLYPGIFYANN